MDLDLLEHDARRPRQPRFRAAQVWAWAARGAPGYDEMTNLPRRAARAARRARAVLVARRSSARRTRATAPSRRCSPPHDGRADRGRADALPRRPALALRVSSQSGCPLTCTFCATGTMKFGRNLTACEILDQALHFRRIEPVDHAVFMGMGEPMMNLDNVLAACERLPDIGITHRRTAISTVGWVPGIDRLAESDMPIRLALSLHAARGRAALARSCRSTTAIRSPTCSPRASAGTTAKRRMVFVEYVMLARRQRPLRAGRRARASCSTRAVFKVNLIPYNPTGMYDGSSREAIAAFKAALEEHGLRATVRLTRGRDIDAACGQLAAKARRLAPA